MLLLQYPDTPFVLPLQPARVILPMSMLQEVIHAPAEQMSFMHEVNERFLGDYTKVGEDRVELVTTVRGDLTKSIGSILSILQDEAAYATEKEFKQPQDWTAFKIYPKMLNLVALLSGRVFVGLPLSREEEWVKLSIEYTLDVGGAAKAATNWNPTIRPFVLPFMPEVRKTKDALARAQKAMAPLVRDILAEHDREKSGPIKAGSRGTFISWILKNSADGLKTARRVGESQMIVSFAAIHTTSMTSAMTVLDLLTYPEYIQPLREEIERVMREDEVEPDHLGAAYFQKSSFAKMTLLDSFIKESQRCSPLGLTNSMRCLLADHTFANGVTLPKGTRVGFPLWAVVRSEKTETFSPEYNQDTGNPGPDVFDGYRFQRLRRVPGRENRHQAATTSHDSPNFGHGPHACPGRFFAIYEIKILLVQLLLNYDMRFKGDVERKGGHERRPKCVTNELSLYPDPEAELEIRRRQRV